MNDINDSMDISFNNLYEMVKNKEAGGAAVHRVSKSRRVSKSQTGLSD